MKALLRLRGSVFAAEQNALYTENTERQTAWRQGPEDVVLLVILAWLVYWAHPGTWRRIPASMRAFVRVAIWWPLARLILRRPKYPFDRKTA